jgi:diguanylate cyclase
MKIPCSGSPDRNGRRDVASRHCRPLWPVRRTELDEVLNFPTDSLKRRRAPPIACVSAGSLRLRPRLPHIGQVRDRTAQGPLAVCRSGARTVLSTLMHQVLGPRAPERRPSVIRSEISSHEAASIQALATWGPGPRRAANPRSPWQRDGETVIQAEVERFVTELDSAVQAHMQWARRVLRCGILGTSPGDDVLQPDAHRLCQFGGWFLRCRRDFEDLDEARTDALEREHKLMHDAIRSICEGVLHGRAGAPSDLDAFEKAQTKLIDHLGHFKTLAVARSSLIDALTGLPMRHRIDHDYELLSKQIGRYTQGLLVLMVDVDHFKGINDLHGHRAGDMVLRLLADQLRSSIRHDDQVYRYGGEEFLLLLALSNPAHAERAVAKLHEATRGLRLALPDGMVARPTVTIGAALAQANESLEAVIRRADMALYAGKNCGRDRWVMAPSCVGGAEVKPTAPAFSAMSRPAPADDASESDAALFGLRQTLP